MVRGYRSYRRRLDARRYYSVHKRQHLVCVRSEAGPSPDPELAATLVADGVAVVRGFLAPEVAQQIADDVRSTIEAVAEGRYGGPLRTLCREDDGLFRLYGVEEELSPASRAFYDSPFLAGIADALTTTGMHSKDRYVDYKSKVGAWDPNVDYHVDHWKTRFKAFLLLEDVTEDQAPFHFVVGSHREAPWRERWDWGYQQHETAGGLLGRADVDRIRADHGYDERVYTGRAGDVILANTRGIHRGSVLRRGTRLMLVNLYAMNGPDTFAG